jgi:hypothetical protein
MSTITFISKRPKGFRFEYTYSCTCTSGTPAKNVVVVASNDASARVFAEQECESNCGERSGTSLQVSEIPLSAPIEFLSFPVPTDERADVNLPHTTNVGDCVLFFHVSHTHVGLTNNCAECRIAAINWLNVGVAKYKVAGYSEIVIERLAKDGVIIRDSPCP